MISIEEVLKKYETVEVDDHSTSPCEKCDAFDKCMEIDGDNPYFRSCHDYGYLKMKEVGDDTDS